MRRWFAVVFAAAGLYAFPGEARAANTCPAPLGALVSIEGQVEFRDHPGAAWRPAPVNVPLCPGATVRVGDRSRATATLPDAPTYRIDQNTTFHLVRAPAKRERPAMVRLVEGALYIFSRRPRTLEVDTPLVDAAVEGTEFLVRVGPTRATVSVFQGTVSARNEHGQARATAGQVAIAEAGRAPVTQLMVRPRDAVEWALHYPPILTVLADPRAATAAAVPQPVREAARRASRGDIPGALERLEAVPAAERGASFHLHRTAILLSVGRVDEARADIDRALAQDPKAGLAYALRSVIAVAQNDNEAALAAGRRAVELKPQSAAAWIALSYAQQARFDLDGARDSLRTAVEAEPKDALAWARLSELWLMFGRRDRAREAAERAAALAPDLARVQSVRGFAALAEFRAQTARQAFERALARDPADPTARFGLGLARIRRGDLEAGRNDIEVAVSLDPNRSLLRSYLGKAYFEERTTNPLTYLKELVNNFPNQENTLAAEQFAIAKELDPKDPTPFLYDAIRKQSENRPVEALRDLEKSIELNDNRAVYRSRALLDQDRAARGTSLARIYNDLGFEQLGINEATKSLSLDPGNAGAHRFLSDVYLTQPRREIARVSELLQAQLLQDININPVQPSLSVTNLNLTSGGPSRPGFNEFTPLFERNQARLNVTGVAGSNNTLGDEAVVSAIYDQLSLSAGQFHYQTQGFRENNHLNYNIYNFFAQAALTPQVNVQAEVRRAKAVLGDLSLNFDPDAFERDREKSIDQDVARLGFRYSPSPASHLIASIVYSDRAEGRDFSGQTTSVAGEAQYIVDAKLFNGVFGGGRSDTQFDFPSLKVDAWQNTGYSYCNLHFLEAVTLTAGLSYDDFKYGNLHLQKVNPKIGFQWDVTEFLRIRLAAFRTLKPPLVASRTIQPTQVAGFNQFFDDFNGTEAWTYGAGVDVRLAPDVSTGLEATRRNLDTPVPVNRDFDQQRENQDENSYAGYIYWAPEPEWAISGEVRYDYYKNQTGLLTQSGSPKKVESWSAPISIRYFHPAGFFVGLTGTPLYQTVRLQKQSGQPDGSDVFFIADAAAGYRFPQRFGAASVEVRNLFNSAFKYQDDSFREARQEPAIGPLIPDRTVVGRITLNF